MLYDSVRLSKAAYVLRINSIYKPAETMHLWRAVTKQKDCRLKTNSFSQNLLRRQRQERSACAFAAPIPARVTPTTLPVIPARQRGACIQGEEQEQRARHAARGHLSRGTHWLSGREVHRVGRRAPIAEQR